jgi:hypothetical protein
MPSGSASIFTSVRPDPAIKIEPDRLAPLSAIACPQCRGYHTTRAHRRTFFQKVVFTRLGYYPWKCIDCSHRFLSKNRGRS